MYPIPNQVFDHYNAGELETLMGLFAEINHAWVVINHFLVLGLHSRRSRADRIRRTTTYHPRSRVGPPETWHFRQDDHAHSCRRYVIGDDFAGSFSYGYACCHHLSHCIKPR